MYIFKSAAYAYLEIFGKVTSITLSIMLSISSAALLIAFIWLFYLFDACFDLRYTQLLLFVRIEKYSASSAGKLFMFITERRLKSIWDWSECLSR